MKIVSEASVKGAIVRLTDKGLNWVDACKVSRNEPSEMMADFYERYLANMKAAFPTQAPAAPFTDMVVFPAGDPRNCIGANGCVGLFNASLHVIHELMVEPEFINDDSIHKVQWLGAKYHKSRVFARRFPERYPIAGGIYIVTPLVEESTMHYTHAYAATGDVAIRDVWRDLESAATSLKTPGLSMKAIEALTHASNGAFVFCM